MSSWRPDSNWRQEDFSVSFDDLVDVFVTIRELLERFIRLRVAGVHHDAKELKPNLALLLELGTRGLDHQIDTILPKTSRDEPIVLGFDLPVVEDPAVVEKLHDQPASSHRRPR